MEPPEHLTMPPKEMTIHYQPGTLSDIWPIFVTGQIPEGYLLEQITETHVFYRVTRPDGTTVTVEIR